MFVGKTVLFLVSPNDDVSRQLFHSRQLATVFTLLIFVMPAFNVTGLMRQTFDFVFNVFRI